MTIVIRKTEKKTKIQTAGKCYVEPEYPSIANRHCKTGSMPGEKNVNISGDEEKERKEMERRGKGEIGARRREGKERKDRNVEEERESGGRGRGEKERKGRK